MYLDIYNAKREILKNIYMIFKKLITGNNIVKTKTTTSDTTFKYIIPANAYLVRIAILGFIFYKPYNRQFVICILQIK